MISLDLYELVVARKAIEEGKNLERELFFLEEIKGGSSQAIFYFEIHIPGCRFPKQIILGKNQKEVIEEGRKKCSSCSARENLYILVPATQEKIAYIGRLGMTGKSLLSGNGLKENDLVGSYGLSPEEVSVIVSSICFFVPENLWKE